MLVFSVRFILLQRILVTLLLFASLETQATVFPDVLPPQRLVDALEKFSRATGLQMIYSSSLVKNHLSPGSAANVPVEDTLRQLLSGTGLDFRFVNSRTVTIVREGQKPRRKRKMRQAQEQLANNSDPDHPIHMVQVTGSHIAGPEPVGSQLIRMTRDDIQRAGYLTVEDVLRSLPRNFRGGAREDIFSSGPDGFNNMSRGSSVNLRGLGAGSTLVLINGRRLAAGAADGRFVDISTIALSAIDRIEIMPDGASAIYGADAVGGVVNFILREDYDGAEMQATVGQSTQSDLTRQALAQTVGTGWGSGKALLSFEYAKRDGLASVRREPTAQSNLTGWGGDNFDVMLGNPGTILTGLQTWAIPKGQNGRSLKPEDLTAGTANFYNSHEGSEVLPASHRLSVMATARQEVSDRVELFSDLLFARRDSAVTYPMTSIMLTVTPDNPFYVDPTNSGAPVQVAYGFGDDIDQERDRMHVRASSLTLGATINAGGGWLVVPYLSHAIAFDEVNTKRMVDQLALVNALMDENPETAFNPFGDGAVNNPATLAAILPEGLSTRETRLMMANITGNTEFELLGQELRVAVGGDFRQHKLSSYFRQGQNVIADTEGERKVGAAYAEMVVPRSTYDVSLALRYEKYNDFGDALMPRFGVSWHVTPYITWRGNLSQSFKAPNLADLDETRNVVQATALPDSSAPVGYSPVLIWGGGNSGLKKETAHSWTTGFELEWPRYIATFGMSYFHINYRNRAEQPLLKLTMLNDPEYAEVITRNPSADLLQEACSSGIFSGGASCEHSPAAALIDLRLSNTAVMSTSGLDFDANFEWSGGVGQLTGKMGATYVLTYKRSRLTESPVEDLLNTPGNPLRFRLHNELIWSRGSFDTSLAYNYSNSYQDDVSFPVREVDAWSTLDMSVRYRYDTGSGGWLDNTALTLSGENILDERPPFLNNPLGIGYDPSNADVRGRLLGLSLSKRW